MTVRDATALTAFSRCEQEGDYRYNRHFASARDEDAPHFGAILHTFRNEYFLREDADAAVSAAKDAWGAYTPADGEKRTWPLAETMMRAYAEHVGPPSARGFKVLAGEQPISDAASGYGGILDALIEVNGELAVDDLKSTGLFPSEAFSRQYEMSNQISGYLDLAEVATGKPVNQAWIEVWSIPRAAKPDWPNCFKRFGPIYYSASLRAELRTLRSNALALADQIQRGLHAPKMNPNACFRYNRLCPFFNACKSDPDIREAVIQSRLAAGEWVEKEWDFTKRGTE